MPSLLRKTPAQHSLSASMSSLQRGCRPPNLTARFSFRGKNGDSMEFCDTFIREKHIKYIVDVGNEKDTLAAVVLASIALKSRSRRSICG